MKVARGIMRLLRSATGRDGRRLIYECRRCGRTLDGEGSSCPACGGDDVARFSI